MFERSYHFIPADRPALFQRVEDLGADVCVLDLEDAVAEEHKAAALSAVKGWLSIRSSQHPLFLRVNGVDHPLAPSERDLLALHPTLSIVLPKVESAEALTRAVEYYGGLDSRMVVGLVESPAAVLTLDAILATGLLGALGFGLEDMLVTSVFGPSELGSFVARVRSEVALHAAAAGIPAIDTISPDLSGGAELERDCAAARSAGMTAKFSIHPRQIAPINRGFSPAPEAVREACRVLDAVGPNLAGCGYARVAGTVISPPKVKKFQRIQEVSRYHESH